MDRDASGDGEKKYALERGGKIGAAFDRRFSPERNPSSWRRQHSRPEGQDNRMRRRGRQCRSRSPPTEARSESRSTNKRSRSRSRSQEERSSRRSSRSPGDDNIRVDRTRRRSHDEQSNSTFISSSRRELLRSKHISGEPCVPFGRTDSNPTFPGISVSLHLSETTPK